MRKTIFFLFVILVIWPDARAQRSSGVYGWFFLAPKANFGTGVLTNQHVFSDSNIEPRLLSFSHTVGGQAGISLMNFLELAYEYEIQSPSARYTIHFNDVVYTKRYGFSQQGHVVLLKVLGNIHYVEVGWGTVRNTTTSIRNHIDENAAATDPAIEDPENIFKDRYNKFLLGVGITPYQSGLLEVELGARLAYGLGNMAETNSPIADNFYNHGYSGMRHSRMINAYVQVQLKYFFGFYGKAICGGRGIMFFQKPKNFKLL